jgi:predicted amidohydrolase YtcJ
MVSNAMSTRSTSRWASLVSSALAVTGCSGQGAAGPTAAPADLVLVGGDLLTMDPARPRAQALAIRGGTIAAVGSDAEVEPLIGPRTRVVRLDGRGATPGLVDAHCHLYGLGTSLESVSLRGAASEAEAARRVAEAAAARPAGEWITGRGWDQNRWTPQQFPGHAALDRAVPDHPVAVRRIDGHAVWLNARALALAGITGATADPPGGSVVRDPAGEPTGVLVDNAMGLVDKVIPEPPPDVRERRILAGARAAVAAGLTGVHEMGIDDATVAVYRALVARDALPLRVYAFRSGDLPTLQALDRGPEPGTPMFAVRGFKLYADGALGSRGAALLAPYDDLPAGAEHRQGLWVTEPADLTRAVELAAAHGWQVAVHAIGDAGVRATLDAFAAAGKQHPGADLRLRVEHAQVIHPDDLPRFAALGVIASMQPTHATSDMGWAEARIGPQRIRGAYAWRSVLASGAHLAAGSDFPIEEVSPLGGLYAAVTRQDPAGHPPGGWYPEQRLTLAEAVGAFTTGAAYASFTEDSRGRLRAGYAADVTVYDRPLAGDASLLRTRVAMTIVAGRVVFEQ